jgi:dienelactone hydrolase
MLVVNNLPETDRNAVKAYFAFPSGPPRGVVFRFHGSNGSGGALFTKAEESRFARDLVADGFAVVALDSNDRQNRQWDNRVNAANPSENKDVANIQGVIQMLVDEGLMTPQTPCFASGHSNGGGFAPRAAYMLGWKASHSSCASSQASLMQITSVPQIFTMMENDELTGPSARAEALANHDLLESRGVASEYWVNPPSALYPTRFMQIEGLSAADSAELYEALKREGFLDEQGFQKQSPRTSGWERALTPNTRERRSAIEDLLKAAYADHSFSADRSALLRRFFAARLE